MNDSRDETQQSERIERTTTVAAAVVERLRHDLPEDALLLIDGGGAALADLYEIARDICTAVEVLIGETDGDPSSVLERMRQQLFYHLPLELVETALYVDRIADAYASLGEEAE